MKKVTFKKLTIRNFKGIEDLVINFEEVTKITGFNGVGKTTIVDAINWILRDKDSKGRQKFDIKNTKKPELNRSEHFVSLVIECNGIETELGKSLTERHVRRRGSEETVLDGNTVDYSIDGVNCETKSKFDSVVAQLFSDDLFSTLTNPYVFGSMDWKKQRAVLMDMAGGVNNDAIIKSMVAKNPKANETTYAKLEHALNEGKSYEDYKKIIAAKKSEINKQKDTIKPKIEENLLGKPDPVNETAINMAISELEKQLEANEKSLLDIAEAQQEEDKSVQSLIKEKNALQLANIEIENGHKAAYNKEKENFGKDLNQVNGQIKDLEASISSKENLIASYKRTNEMLEQRKAAKLNEWHEVNKRVFDPIPFDENKLTCECCGQVLPEEKRQELINNQSDIVAQQLKAFEEKKAHDKAAINQEGKALANDIAKNNQLIEPTQKVIDQYELDLNSLREKYKTLYEESKESVIVPFEERVMNDDTIAKNLVKISELTEAINNRPKVGDQEHINNVRAQISDIKMQILQQNKLLSTNEQIKRVEDRHKELIDLEKKLAKELAQLEKEEFHILEYVSTMVEEINNVVSNYFPEKIGVVLFENHYNGSISEKCEITYDDVTFSMLNTAHQVLTGVEVINVLSDYYSLRLPIMIDNKESVLIDLPVKDNQIILLSAADGDLSVSYG